jgi:hypothetical protein
VTGQVPGQQHLTKSAYQRNQSHSHCGVHLYRPVKVTRKLRASTVVVGTGCLVNVQIHLKRRVALRCESSL